MERKLQIFVSSTYIDLKVERQKVVQAILDAGHIPAGMELFNAGDESQMTTIERWIDDSDIYILLLGKRYGSIEPTSRKSYTQLEYEYALKKKKPLFGLIIENPSGEGDETALDEYKDFKKLVLSKIVKFCIDIKDVMYNTVLSISDLERRYEDKLIGWSRGNNTKEVNKLLRENIKLSDKVSLLERKLQKEQTKKTEKFGTLTYDEIIKILSKEVKLPEWMTSTSNKGKMPLSVIVSQISPFLASGVTNAYGADKSEMFIYTNVAQELLAIGLAEINKGPGSATWQRIKLNKDGQRFIQQLNKKLVAKNAKESTSK